MCLRLHKFSRKKIAKKDIEVYKVLMYRKAHTFELLHGLKPGSNFTGIINNIPCEGVFYTHSLGKNYSLWFFTNNKKLVKGKKYPFEKPKEYKHSFKADSVTCLQSIVVDGVEYVNRIEEVLLTPYRSAKIVLGETYLSSLEVLGENYFSSLKIKRKYNRSVVETGLHCFKHIRSAKRFIKNDILNYYTGELKIAKCIIPKGASFYNGLYQTSTNGFFNHSVSYAADMLKYVEIIQNENSKN